MLSSACGKSGGGTARLSGTGAPALAGGAVADRGNSLVRGDAAGGRAPAIGEWWAQQLEAEGWHGLKKAGRAEAWAGSLWL
jgi:hypothetical protein